jgi:hypothetical protein
MGTVGYMSPEQAQGKAVDQRSDIFSFGCILYEAATGKRAFEGDSAIDTLHKIIYSTPAPVTDLNPDLPADLQRIIRRCLAKEPEKRYQTIRDVANDLDDLQSEFDMESLSGRTIPPASATSEVSRYTQASNRSVNCAATERPTSSAEYLVSQIINHKGVVAAGVIVLLAVIAYGYWYSMNRASGSSDVITSLAVMPFVNASGNADAEYLLYRYDLAVDRAIEIEPTLADIRNNLAACLVASGRVDEGIDVLKQTIAKDPTFAWLHSHISYIYRLKGDHATSVEERARSAELLDQAENAKRMRDTFAREGWTAYVRELLQQDWGSLGTSPTRRASFLAELGEKEEAMASLIHGAERGDWWLFSIKYDPAFDTLRDDARFQQLLKKFEPPQ